MTPDPQSNSPSPAPDAQKIREQYASGLGIVLGGVNVTAQFRDGSEKEIVLVRELAIRELPIYLQVCEDEGASIELFCSKPPGWADKLTLESAEEVLTAGDAINSPPFCKFMTRRISRNKEMLAHLDADQTKVLQGVLSSILPAPPKSA